MAPFDLDLPERQVTLGKDGHIATIGVRERLDSHKLIEEFMVLANAAAAQALEQRRALPLPRPRPARPRQARSPARIPRHTRDQGTDPPAAAPRGTSTVSCTRSPTNRSPARKPDRVGCSQSQAVYSPDNLGHFGLALARYAHFTSPIRRFPDLIVHRALIAAYGLGEGGLSAEDKGRFTEFGEHLSMRGRRAVAAERGAMDRYVAAFMAGHVGAVFPGRVNGVTRFGLFATLEGTGADGPGPHPLLGQEFFRHDEGRQVLIGERTGETFGLGDRLQIKLVEADTATGGLLFEIVDADERVERQAAPRSFRSTYGKERSGPPRRPVAHRGPPRDSGSRRRGRSPSASYPSWMRSTLRLISGPPC